MKSATLRVTMGDRNDQFTPRVQKGGFKLADSHSDEGVIADVAKGAALKVRIANPATHKLEDVTQRIMHGWARSTTTGTVCLD